MGQDHPLRRRSMYLFIQLPKARFLKLYYVYQNRHTITDWKGKVIPVHVINAYRGIGGKALLIPVLGTGWR